MLSDPLLPRIGFLIPLELQQRYWACEVNAKLWCIKWRHKESALAVWIGNVNTFRIKSANWLC